MGRAEGFTYTVRKNGEVVVHHHGRLATVLRGRPAERFLAAVGAADAAPGADQELMARLTGNYKHGNERLPAKRSP